MLRLYLVGKFIVVHSQLLTDPTTQTIGAVSHVKININFVFKVSVRPWTVFIVGQFDVALFSALGLSNQICYRGVPQPVYVPPNSFRTNAVKYL